MILKVGMVFASHNGSKFIVVRIRERNDFGVREKFNVDTISLATGAVNRFKPDGGWNVFSSFYDFSHELDPKEVKACPAAVRYIMMHIEYCDNPIEGVNLFKAMQAMEHTDGRTDG